MERSAEIERWSRAFLTLSMQAMEGEESLRPSALRALLALDRAPAPGVAALAETLGLSRSATSRLVDRLVRQGYVDRREDAGDRRQVLVATTDEGRDVVRRLVDRRRRAVRRVVAAMDPADRVALERGLAAFARAADVTDAPPGTRTA